MGIFSRNFDRPGPGVRKDEPRKKGAARFFELFFRDFGDLVKLNLLFTACVLPSLIFFVFGEMTRALIFHIVALILAFPIGGALTAYVYYITRMMRDDPSYVWFEFKRKFKENYKQAAILGIICTAFVYTQIMLWLSLMRTVEYEMLEGMIEGSAELSEALVVSAAAGIDFWWLIIALFSLLIFGMITPYIFMNFAYLDLRTFGVIKNSVLMAFGFLPRSFMGAILGGTVWIAFALFFPLSIALLPFVALFGVSLSMMLTYIWVWKPFDNYFKIEETLVARAKEAEQEEESISKDI